MEPNTELETPVEAVADARPAKAAILSEALDLSEATMDADMRVLRNVVLIKAGMSLNRKYYSEAVLQKAAPVFEGVNAYDSHSRSHKVGETTGWYKNVRYEEGKLRADRYFSRTQSGNDVFALVQDIIAGNAPPTVAGLSINASGTMKQKRFDDGDGHTVESITKAESVDDVTSPAAGGTYLAASAGGDALTDALLKAMSFEEWFESRPDFVRRVQNEMKTVRQDDALKAALAVAEQRQNALHDAQTTLEAIDAERDAALSEADAARRALAVEKALNAVTIPASWKDSLRADLSEADPGQWAAIIDSEKAKASTAGYKPRPTVSGAGAQEQSAAPVKEAFSPLPKASESVDDWLGRVARST